MTAVIAEQGNRRLFHRQTQSLVFCIPGVLASV
jgi:hypothetical protein